MSKSLPVVFVHGVRLSGDCWQQQARLLDSRDVVAPDLPGHGARRGESFSVDAAVVTIREAIDQVGGRAVLVGHSLGGFVSMATAARHPDAVAALVGVGCSLVPGAALRGTFRLGYRALTASGDDGAALSARTMRRVLPSEVAEPIISAGIATEVVPAVMEAAARIDSLDLLARYPGRVLLLNGRRDHFRFDERRFLAATRDGSLQIVPGAGHYLPLTHGAVCARIVDDVARLAATDARAA